MYPEEPNELEDPQDENPDTFSDQPGETETNEDYISEAPETEPVASPPPAEKPKKKRSFAVLWILLVIVLVAGGFYGYKIVFPEVTGPRINPLNLVPANAVFVIETDEAYNVWKELSGTRIWKTLEKDDEWKEYGEALQELEGTLSDFDKVIDVLSDRSIYLSAHPYRKDEHDYLFIIDMNGLGVVRTWLTKQENLTQRKFKEQTLYEQFDPETKETLYFAFTDNFLVGSYTHTLVEASISGSEDAALSRDFEFIDVRKKVLGEGLVRTYLNYETFYPYMESFIGEENTEIMKENLPLLFSGFYFDVEQDALFLEGYSNYNDSIPTYLNLMEAGGTGNLDIAHVLPARTSMYFSMGFNEFSDFYNAFDLQIREDPELGEDYKLYTKRTEKFLDVNLKEDFAGWIDDEIAIIQLESDSYNNETAMILKAKSAKLATEKMAFLSRQIKRKTPVKFKTITYKGYPINFMSVKGLFNLVLGNLFKHFDRPYYAIIDEYVVFSNQPQVLRRIIDDYILENTLANLESYQEFEDKIGEKHSALLYMQLPLLENSEGAMIDKETAQLLKEKRAFIEDFPQLAFKINPDGKMYRTKALVSIENMQLPDPKLYDVPFVGDTINYDSLLRIDPGEQIEIAEIEIEDLGAKKQKEKDEEGNLLYEVELKDGKKHGSYFEYYPTGELKTKGKYKNDEPDGTWKFYSEDGDLIKREKYKNGKLQE